MEVVLCMIRVVGLPRPEIRIECDETACKFGPLLRFGNCEIGPVLCWDCVHRIACLCCCCLRCLGSILLTLFQFIFLNARHKIFVL
jgi:hypothetical protein